MRFHAQLTIFAATHFLGLLAPYRKVNLALPRWFWNNRPLDGHIWPFDVGALCGRLTSLF